jgi:ATP-dependent DNA helicase 2 subunit 1
MAPYDDWNKVDEEEDEELQENSVRSLVIVWWPTRLTISILQYFERKHDVILFAIDCSQSMLALHEDPSCKDKKTSHLLAALDAAVQIQKRKVVVGPYDSVGIMLYNTVRLLLRIMYSIWDDMSTQTRRNESGSGSEIKKGTYVYQPMSVINAPKILDLNQLIDGLTAPQIVYRLIHLFVS